MEQQMNKSLDIQIFGTENDTIVEGPGLRFGVFVQGCSHKCKGCHNQGSWDALGGVKTTTAEVLREIKDNALVSAVTLSGGEPFEQAPACAQIASELKCCGYNVWCYTGYLYEELLERAASEPDVQNLLDNIDVLVDGPFVESLHSYDLTWRGSSNQRLIDMNKTRQTGKVVLWKEHSFELKKPDNW